MFSKDSMLPEKIVICIKSEVQQLSLAKMGLLAETNTEMELRKKEKNLT